jgi:phosphatidylethanolamine-binding protein (PEBP) family uncharacterized protein
MIGRLLKGISAGEHKSIWARTVAVPTLPEFILSSPAFVHDASMSKEVCVTSSPPLSWSGVPARSHSLVLICEDSDVPLPKPVLHLFIDQMKPQDGSYVLGALAEGRTGGNGQLQRRAFFKREWLPAAPPPGHGPHRYMFQLYALKSGAHGPAPRKGLADHLNRHAIAKALLTGTFER